MTTLAPKVVSTALGALTDELLIRKCFSLATLRFPLATVAVATDASSEKKANKASLSTTDKLAEATRTLNILCLNAPLDLFPRGRGRGGRGKGQGTLLSSFVPANDWETVLGCAPGAAVVVGL